MSPLDSTARKKIADIVRRFSTPHDGEKVATAHALLRLLNSYGLDIHAVADVLEGATGEIGGVKLITEDEARVIYQRGFEKGKSSAGPGLNPQFYESDGSPRWHEIALFCQDRHERLHSEWERTFIADMTVKVLYRTPTPKMADCLIKIFYRLGGKRAA